ncbi:AraC family transcriptional regulator ligand-binding domain-containing protein [Nioella aestuarii]|uniref:AraC family transcriptional regulator ligand-binding domain-containing protein n=1 Tax=Nioella aestuarii TaxID=1662864 RepID=UPI003D7FCFFE
MPPPDRYPIAKHMERVCLGLKLSADRVLARAGQPVDLFLSEGRGATAAQFFSLWHAAEAEFGSAEMAFELAMMTSKGHFIPALFAFSSSPTVEIGFQRLSLFKPLAGPFRLDIRTGMDGLSLRFASLSPTDPLPDSLAAFEIIFLVNMMRNLTGEHVTPKLVELPAYTGDQTRLEAFLGCPLRFGNDNGLHLAEDTAGLPLISHDDELWEMFEPRLRRDLDALGQRQACADRVRAALIEMLPAGRATAEAVGIYLGLSTRSLHRRLSEEGTSFQTILNATRTELSLHYLRRDDVSIEEISYLLAFRDPNSFYRAFRGWTGMTPREARMQDAL